MAAVSNRTEFDKEIDCLLSRAEETIPNEVLPDLPFTKDFPNIPQWHDFEHKLWAIGEEIRQVSVASKKAFNKHQIDRIVHICLDKKAKRGRQSFLMLMGKTKYCDCANVLVPLLSDDDVNGHVIDTLYKMRAKDYVALITPFLNHQQTWIRNAAKKYVRKFEKTDSTV